MGKSYPIWIDVKACIYQGSKSYGAKNENEQTIKVGSSASNSHELVNLRTSKRIIDDKVVFRFFVDGLKIKDKVFTNNNGRAGELLETINYLKGEK